MNAFETISSDALRAGRADALDDAVASALTAHPLDGIETEYPHYQGAVEGPDAPPRPSEKHPAFYGCFDWHSAVHSHWALVRLLRVASDHPDEGEIATVVDGRLTPEHVAGEVEYLDANPSFEEPYGWSWLLRLAAELRLWDDSRADAWRETLRPLEDRVRRETLESFLGVDRPHRVGTHGNTAFALAGVLDYARVVGDAELEREAETTAIRLYADDSAGVVGAEPVGWDFVSPALTEADLMRRVLAPDPFAAWLDGFLPDLTGAPHDALLTPVDVEPDEVDGAAMHLIGLNVSRAWCLAGLADALSGREGPAATRLREPLDAAARRHAEAGAADVLTDDYAGSHWLSSFAVYLLTRNEGGIAPGTA
ncbi:hypothetical protein DJ82_04425 [Halorubrum sp. Ib24]|uniref:DUF2891 domain-containing protein n=1 Tax=Halorubrum sp. Ib24 TaxID=1383850 RepID=UPI000B986991|nr:DUF2891 domain-containing protein [Halorubrum sp. Ib24]OYR41660.1 hypothetical protein DJ82_04425 [Halorubrum sp. Ib24]